MNILKIDKQMKKCTSKHSEILVDHNILNLNLINSYEIFINKCKGK